MAPEAIKPVPVNVVALIVTAALPVEESVRVCDARMPTATSPKSTLLVLRVSVGTEALSCSVKLCVTPPALAVRMADCEEPAGEADAVKTALLAPAGTVTAAGTLTSELLLARFTANPPLADAAFSVTEQLTVPDPEIDPAEQLSAFSTGTPVPLRPIAADPPAKELLVSVSCPVTAPALEGANCTFSVAVCPGFSVSGKLCPAATKPVPARAAALMVTGPVPVEERITG